MINQLENLCRERGIRVEFISYNFIGGSDDSELGQPVIKVHKIFKECPMKVATAVVEIFTEEGYTSECIETIENYLKDKFGPVGIKVKAPAVIIKRPDNKEVNIPVKGKEGIFLSREEQYLEADISYIDVAGIKGEQNRIKDNELLSLKEQDILELDIVVSPPLHK